MHLAPIDEGLLPIQQRTNHGIDSFLDESAEPICGSFRSIDYARFG